MPMKRQMQRIPAWTLATVLALCGFWIALGSILIPMARNHDFLNLYTGASLAREGHFADLHDPAVQLARERQILPQLTTVVPFVRPGFYAMILAPMAWLPYHAAFAVWITVQCALLLVCWAWGWRRFGPDALVFAALFLPAQLGIATGQDCVMVLAVFIAAFVLAERQRRFASGAVLALLLWKFHLVLLWPVALLVQKRWRMLAGFGAAAAAEVLACVALAGPGVIRSYAALLTNKNLDHLSPSPELMISGQGLLANLGIESTVALFAVSAPVVLVFLWAVRDASLWKMFTLTPVASLWVVPHVYGYDASVLLLAIWLTIFRADRPAPRIMATLLATPVPFGFALAGRPWAIVSSGSLLLFFAILVSSKVAPVNAKLHPAFSKLARSIAGA
jgi:hypothetical protein